MQPDDCSVTNEHTDCITRHSLLALCANVAGAVKLKEKQGAKMALKAGDPAPDFSLPAVSGEQQFEFRLSDYFGKQCVVITFHPLDWTPT
jgi:hypothetical protein